MQDLSSFAPGSLAHASRSLLQIDPSTLETRKQVHFSVEVDDQRGEGNSIQTQDMQINISKWTSITILRGFTEKVIPAGESVSYYLPDFFGEPILPSAFSLHQIPPFLHG